MSESLSGLGYSASGELAEVEWSWFCPRHYKTLEAEPGRCADCGGLPVPAAR